MNPEMQNESPEDVAQKIAELNLAKMDDASIDHEAQLRLNNEKGRLRKELHGMGVSEERGVELVQAAEERITAEEEEAKKDIGIGGPSDLEQAA